MANSTLYSRLKKWYQNNVILMFAWLSFTTIITLYSVFSIAVSLYNSSTFGHIQQQYRKIQKLTTNRDIEIFKNILGIPTSSYTLPDNRKVFIFIDEYFFVRAVVDVNNLVKEFSVTSRKKDFHPTYVVHSAYNMENQNDGIFKLTLNKDTFQSIKPTIENIEGDETVPYCSYEWWAKGFSYSEGYYLGGDGLYQSVFVGIDDDGYFDKLIGSAKMWKFDLFQSNNCRKIPLEFRKNKINSFMLTSEASNSALMLLRKKDSSVRVGVETFEVGLK